MVAREPADTPTEQFVPRFTDPGLGARLRAARVADGDDDAGLSLFDVSVDPGEEPVAHHHDAPPAEAAASRRRRTAVIACLVLVAAALGGLTGYVVVTSTGTSDSIWSSAGEGTAPPPSPGTSLGPAQQAQGVPSASPSPSAGPSDATPSAGLPTREQPESGGGTIPPTTPGSDPTRESPSPSPSMTSPPHPSEPAPSTTTPDDS